MKRSKGRGFLQICGFISLVCYDYVLVYIILETVRLYKEMQIVWASQWNSFVEKWVANLFRLLHLEFLQIEWTIQICWAVAAVVSLFLFFGLLGSIWAVVGKPSALTVFHSIIAFYLTIGWVVLTVWNRILISEQSVTDLLFQEPCVIGIVLAGFFVLYFIALARRYRCLRRYWNMAAQEEALADEMDLQANNQFRTVRGSWVKGEDTKAVSDELPIEPEKRKKNKRWSYQMIVLGIAAVLAVGFAGYMGVVYYQNWKAYQVYLTKLSGEFLTTVPTISDEEPSLISRLNIVGYWECVQVDKADDTVVYVDDSDGTGRLIAGLMEDHQAYFQIEKGSLWNTKQSLIFYVGTWEYIDSAKIRFVMDNLEMTAQMINGSLVCEDGQAVYYMEKDADFSPSLVQQNLANVWMIEGTWIGETSGKKITFTADGQWKTDKDKGFYIAEYGDRITVNRENSRSYFDIAEDKLDFLLECDGEQYRKEEDAAEMTEGAEQETTGGVEG